MGASEIHTSISDIIENSVNTCYKEPSLHKDYARLMLNRFVDGVTLAEPLPDQPAMFITNHQISMDPWIFACCQMSLTNRPARIFIWSGFKHMHPGEVALRILDPTHPNTLVSQDWIKLRIIDLRFRKDVMAFFQETVSERETLERPSNILVAAEGTLQFYDNQPVEGISGKFVDHAVQLSMPIVPVRFAWALPEQSTGAKHRWPYDLAPLHIFTGQAIDPHSLADLDQMERRQAVMDAMNALSNPAPEGHRSKNESVVQRVDFLVKNLGMSQSKAIVFDLFMSQPASVLSEETRQLCTWMSDEPAALRSRDTGWLYELAVYLSEGLATATLPLDDLYKGSGGFLDS